MKSRSRILYLVSVLSMANFASAYAWPPEPGSCFIYCDGVGQTPVAANSSQDCCTQSHLCPDHSYPEVTTWEPDEGWPMICPPYGE